MPFLRPDHRGYKLFVSVTRVLISFLGAGLSNFIWLAAFLTFSEKPPGGPVSWLLWCLAPPITAGLRVLEWVILNDKLTFEALFTG